MAAAGVALFFGLTAHGDAQKAIRVSHRDAAQALRVSQSALSLSKDQAREDALRQGVIARKFDLDYDLGLVTSATSLNAHEHATLRHVAELQKQGDLAWEVAQPPRYRDALASYDSAVRLLYTVAQAAQDTGTCSLCSDKYRGRHLPSSTTPPPLRG